MMRTVIAVGIVAAFVAGVAIAADHSLVGKYSGRVDNPRAKAGAGNVDLTIASVEGGVVKARSRSYSGNCAGEYALEGRLENEKLHLKATTPGRLADCAPEFNLTVEGGKLVGTNAVGNPVQFSK
jgi:hypothetical protein